MFTFLSKYWWTLVVRGVVAILLGIFVFVRQAPSPCSG
jgi:uncharacterized membrane protein HdeD (DUF308 family)